MMQPIDDRETPQRDRVSIPICLYTRPLLWGEWNAQVVHLARIPHIGEYILLSSETEWYEVQVVVHTLGEHEEYQAEVYAQRMDIPLQYKSS